MGVHLGTHFKWFLEPILFCYESVKTSILKDCTTMCCIFEVHKAWKSLKMKTNTRPQLCYALLIRNIRSNIILCVCVFFCWCGPVALTGTQTTHDSLPRTFDKFLSIPEPWHVRAYSPKLPKYGNPNGSKSKWIVHERSVNYSTWWAYTVRCLLRFFRSWPDLNCRGLRWIAFRVGGTSRKASAIWCY